ncbi:hypothetical protein [Candidatus Enterovibrio escicola]|nr:hypothetical protein [Candidatus Enterovibrio escacola]
MKLGNVIIIVHAVYSLLVLNLARPINAYTVLFPTHTPRITIAQ